MNDAEKYSRFAASIFSFAAFAIGCGVAGLLFDISNQCGNFTHGAGQAGLRSEAFEKFAHWACAAIGFACAVFVFRACRRRISPGVIFHVSFGCGFALLCFCLWLTLFYFPAVDTTLVIDWSTAVLSPFLSGPLICLLVVPIALLLLSYATLCDNRNAQKSAPADRALRRRG